MNVEEAKRALAELWRDSIVPALREYIAIPNESPAFDANWREHGHMQRAVALIVSWIRTQNVRGLQLEVVELPGRTPLLFVEVPGVGAGTVVLYGHLDKQPPMHGWAEGLGPWAPVEREGRLYGRGGADDGYAAFASIAAIAELQRQGIPHPRCVILIEACEESGSPDLPAYVEALAPRLGSPDLVICLDSGCGNYEQMWVTTSLRGLADGTLNVTVLEEGVHSGAATGIVPSSFRIARSLLSRIEDEATGRILLPELHAEIPAERRRQAEAAARVLGAGVCRGVPFAGATRPASDDPAALLLRGTWEPGLEVIGADGFPPTEHAGNVLRPTTRLKLSVRLPPTVDAGRATAALKKVLEDDPPHGARVSFDDESGATGWSAPVEQPWLGKALQRASRDFFGRDACYMGEGGTIPFMGMLGARFPRAQFVITGVLGPKSNAHGPNEFLDLQMAERLTGCVASIVEQVRPV